MNKILGREPSGFPVVLLQIIKAAKNGLLSPQYLLDRPRVSQLWLSHKESCRSSFQSLHPQPQYFQLDALWQQRMPQQQLSQCVYSGSISGSIFMLSIIQLVTPPWAALLDREPAHWSYAMGESQAGRQREGEAG